MKCECIESIVSPRIASATSPGPTWISDRYRCPEPAYLKTVRNPTREDSLVVSEKLLFVEGDFVWILPLLKQHFSPPLVDIFLFVCNFCHFCPTTFSKSTKEKLVFIGEKGGFDNLGPVMLIGENLSDESRNQRRTFLTLLFLSLWSTFFQDGTITNYLFWEVRGSIIIIHSSCFFSTGFVQLIVNWWFFGPVVWDSNRGTPKNLNPSIPFIFEDPRTPNHQPKPPSNH